MAVAACQGGVAFSNSSVALVHGMSRPLGAIFHIAHGLSNSVLLPAVTRYSLEAATPRYATIARTMGYASAADSDAAAAQALADGLEELNRRLEVPRLRDLPWVTEERFEASLEKMAADALASGSPARNPRVPRRGRDRRALSRSVLSCSGRRMRRPGDRCMHRSRGGCMHPPPTDDYSIVGITKLAPARMPVGQREVTVLVFV